MRGNLWQVCIFMSFSSTNGRYFQTNIGKDNFGKWGFGIQKNPCIFQNWCKNIRFGEILKEVTWKAPLMSNTNPVMSVLVDSVLGAIFLLFCVLFSSKIEDNSTFRTHTLTCREHPPQSVWFQRAAEVRKLGAGVGGHWGEGGEGKAPHPACSHFKVPCGSLPNSNTFHSTSLYFMELFT